MRRLIRSATLTNFAEVARGVGLDPPRMLSEFGLPQACLREPELKVPIDAVRQLLEAAAERSGEQAFGLRMAMERRLSNLGPLGLLVREQPTLKRALEALARYANRVNSALFLTIEESGDVVVVREELIVGGSGSVRQSTELAIGVAFRTLQAVLSHAWQPLRVCFAHDAPADRRVHDRVFGRIVEFGHDFNGIVCKRADLEAANPDADPLLAKYAEDLLETSIANRHAAMTHDVRQLVVAMIGTGRCTIDLAAQHLGMNRRTIHRQLAGEGETFSGIVDAVRRELAERYMKDRARSLAEVSSMLGFAAPSGFSRWYRRNFSSAPTARRKGRGGRTR
jgi:AraC-like DNA-binding protein